MPIHDWSRVDAGLFHAFHQSWIVHLCDALNAGGLEPEYFALPEQWILGPIPDVLTLRTSGGIDRLRRSSSGIASAVASPLSRQVRQLDDRIYAHKANRVMIRHRLGQLVTVIEIVSPGNKSSRAELRAFIEETSDLIGRGIHLLLIDLFPPTKRDKQGIHKLIWDQLEDDDFNLPADKPLMLASYEAARDRAAYLEPVAVGDVLPSMPLFLGPDHCMPTPLEATYQTTWKAYPAPMRRLLESPPGSPLESE